MKQVLTYAAAIGLALVALPATAETKFQPWQQEGVAKRPYIFTQQHNAEIRPGTPEWAQFIRLGYPLQVQLPGNPALWTFRPEESQLVEYRGRTMVYSPNRIDDTQSLLVFDLALSPEAQHGSEGYFTFTTNELPQSLDNVVPGGVFVVHFTVIDPK